MADLGDLQRALLVSFKDLSLLELALVHSSFHNENPGFTQISNERLEFLGDAVLGLIVAEKLYRDYPYFSEGEMTRLRAALVRKETLSRLAKTLKLGDYLFLGKGEEADNGRVKPANLASALEAVIAAIFLDLGFSSARDFILNLIDAELKKAVNQTSGVDYKSELQELIQSREQKPPDYHLIQTTGPDHSKIFTVEVRLNETVLGTGTGKSKKAAEVEAARSALEKLTNNFTH
ncbi:ribonuclease III [Chloroflexota bacterium]